MSTLVVTLPWPATALWPNRSNGKHWASKSGNVARARMLAKVATLEAIEATEYYLDRPWSGIRFTVTFCPPAVRRYDLENAYSAIKGAQDGIADALGIDDVWFNPVLLQRGQPEKPGCVVVEIEVQPL